MGLIFERPASDGPGCHAFIVGVSKYPHAESAALSLKSLSCAAGSAYHVYRWICGATLAVPLASVRLLLSPVEGESIDHAAAPCTLDNFIRDAYGWRKDASRHRENITFFFFAGHGFSPSQGDQLLVLQEFGDGIGPLLRNAVSVNNLVYGMSPGAAGGEVARTQLYFVDAGRTRISSVSEYQTMNATAVFDASPQVLDDRTAPIFFATSPDAEAYAFPNQVTLFSRALIEGLDGAAAVQTDDGRWGVSVLSLGRYLPVRVQELARESGATQTTGVEGSLRDSMLAYLSGPPAAEITVGIEPAEAAESAIIQMFDFEGQQVGEWKTMGAHIQAHLPAGIYQMDVSGEVSGTPFTKRKFVDIRPSKPNMVNIHIKI